MLEGYPGSLNLLPLGWPDTEDGGPGDKKHILPLGFLQGPPAIVRPYGDPPKDEYYGRQERQSDPLLAAPMTDATGGSVYFETQDPAKLETLFTLMGVPLEEQKYAAIAMTVDDPLEERFLGQMRVITHAALRGVFNIDAERMPPDQTVPMGRALTEFVEEQVAWLNPQGRAFPDKLRGTAGGDGDWAKEVLGFGFHVENAYWGVFRIWSRSWLATK